MLQLPRLQELSGRWEESIQPGGTPLSAAEETELKDLEQQYEDRVWEEKYELADFLSHDELYQNYPQLRRAGLVFDHLEDGVKGFFNPRSNTIVLSDTLFGEKADVLLHEIQHIIQNAEGFAGGASPAYWAMREYETGNFVSDRLRREYDQILNGLGREDRNRYTRYTELGRELESLSTADPDTEAGHRYDRLEAEQDTIYAELYPNEWFQQLLDLSRRMEDTAGEYRRMYENTAGEIEARDVTDRRRMTPEQRRETMPNTGDENTVFAEQTEDSYSMSEPADAQQHPQRARRIRKTAEPSTVAQDEADRLFLQGVDADTIREMTGLERTEDGDWRLAVDTDHAAAYDGGRTTEQQGGADNGQDTTLRGIYGDDARGRETEGTDQGRTGRSGTSDARGSAADEGRGRAAPASWARGRLIDRPSPAAGIAAENAGRYETNTLVCWRL